MNFFSQTLLLILGTLLYTPVFNNGQAVLVPAGRHGCPQTGAIRSHQPPYYPRNVIIALEQQTQDISSNAAPAEPTPQTPRCRPDASRVFTKLFSLPGAVADSLLSGDIMF